MHAEPAERPHTAAMRVLAWFGRVLLRIIQVLGIVSVGGDAGGELARRAAVPRKDDYRP